MFILARAFALLAIAFLFSLPNHADAAMHTIRGRVTSYVTGLPVADAQINASIGGSQFASVRTSDDGRYTIVSDVDSLPGDTGTIHVWTNNYIYAQGSFDPAENNVTLDFVLRQFGRILGTVRNADTGEPIANVLTQAIHFNGSSWVVKMNRSSEGNGDFFLFSLFPDTYRACAGGIGTRFARRCFDGFDIHSTNDLAAATPVVVSDGEDVSGIQLPVSEGGRIRGSIRDERNNNPIRTQLFFELYDTNGNLLEETSISSDDSGTYDLSGVPDGTFYMAVRIGYGAMRGKRLYPNIECPAEACPPVTSGQTIVVSHGSIVDGIDFSFRPVATLSGKVTDRSTGQPLGGVKVVACVLPIIIWGDCYLGMSNAVDGRYGIDLDNKRYMIYAVALESHANQIYPDTACLDDFCQRNDAFSFMANEGDHLSGYDFALRRSSRISGTVLHASTGEPLSWATVAVFDANYKFLWSVWPTNESGSYLTAKWPSGTYYLAAYYSWSSSCGFYLDRPCPPSATDQAAIAAVHPTPVVVEDGELREGIDIRFLPDRIFASYFDEGADEKQPADAIH